jgi:hypothetical protein
MRCAANKECSARDPGEKRGNWDEGRGAGTSTLLLTRSLVSAAMLAPRKGAVAELALVLLLRQRRFPHLRR